MFIWSGCRKTVRIGMTILCLVGWQLDLPLGVAGAERGGGGHYLPQGRTSLSFHCIALVKILNEHDDVAG